MQDNQVKAPKWFVEMWKERQVLDEKIAKILGESHEWLKRPENDITPLLDELTGKEKKKLTLLQEYGRAMQNLAWARFRSEHAEVDLNGAMAEQLKLDEKTWVITFKESDHSQNDHSGHDHLAILKDILG